MVLTMNDLIIEFSAQTGYCHSDEITLIFYKLINKNENDIKNKVHIFNGRSDKLISLISS